MATFFNPILTVIKYPAELLTIWLAKKIMGKPVVELIIEEMGKNYLLKVIDWYIPFFNSSWVLKRLAIYFLLSRGDKDILIAAKRCIIVKVLADLPVLVAVIDKETIDEIWKYHRDFYMRIIPFRDIATT